MWQPPHGPPGQATDSALTDITTTLADPRSYPFPVARVEVRHTHISAVFLAGEFAYKVKKPVNLGFLNFVKPTERKLPGLDSNQDKENQNLLCYRYTTG